ncbi:hypothetical protein LJC60_08830, partial [Ruminococcaceae bacterium OttesenSCG-928-D13]|nr:hypothetical protein [Ruminococcaceae bacterium OttesenSCG-928-D13]
MRRTLAVLLCFFTLCGLLCGCENLPDYLTPPDSGAVAPFGPTNSGPASGPTEVVPVEEVPVAALLHKEYAGRDNNSVYGDLLLEKSTENKDIWLGKVEKVFGALVDAEALPAGLWDQILPLTWRDSLNFTVLVDNLGSESIHCNLTTNKKPPHYLQCNVESQKGIALSASASLPLGYPITSEERDALLWNFLCYQGLDVFGDWVKEEYLPKTGDLPSADFTGYLTVYNSESANLSASLQWQGEDEN